MLRVSTLLFILNAASAHSDRMSRHLVVEDLSMVVILADAEQTQGPFPVEEEDYAGSDLTAAGRAGSPGLEEDRASVVDGIPFTFTVNIYDVSDASTAVEFENVEVFVWHSDAIGVYSAVEDGNPFQPGVVGVADQIWCRGKQVTAADGKVTFQTIMAGWYPGRSIHYHIRLRFPGEQDFAATTQVYITDADLDLYEGIEPYATNDIMTQTPLATDMFYNQLDPAVGEMLQLELIGDVESGFSSSIDLGLVPGAVSDNPGPWTNPPGFPVPSTMAPAEDPSGNLLGECEFDCDKDSDCDVGLLCADEHKRELRDGGCDVRAAYCVEMRGRRDEVCYDPSKLDTC